MRDWNFWEWLAYASLWVTGLIEASGVALLRAREVRRRLPRVLRSHNWAFLPLALLTISTIILVVNAEFSNVPAKAPIAAPQTSGRIIKPEQAATFVQTVKSMKAALNLTQLAVVEVAPEVGCSECTDYAIFIAKMLNDAGFRADASGSILGPNRKSGVSVAIIEPVTPDETILLAAFTAAHIEIDVVRSRFPPGVSPQPNRPIEINVTPGHK